MAYDESYPSNDFDAGKTPEIIREKGKTILDFLQKHGIGTTVANAISFSGNLNTLKEGAYYRDWEARRVS